MIEFLWQRCILSLCQNTRRHGKAKMLKAQEVEPLVGHAIGGVCPFGIRENVRVFLDVSLQRFDRVYPAAGSANSAIALDIPSLQTYATAATAATPATIFTPFGILFQHSLIFFITISPFLYIYIYIFKFLLLHIYFNNISIFMENIR